MIFAHLVFVVCAVVAGTIGAVNSDLYAGLWAIICALLAIATKPLKDL